MSALDNLTLRRLAMYVDQMDRRLADLEGRLSEYAVPPHLGRQVINRGRWWYAVDETGKDLNNPGFKTREEADRCLAANGPMNGS